MARSQQSLTARVERLEQLVKGYPVDVYPDQREFEQHLRIVVRTYRAVPSNKIIAHALGLDLATLKTVMERFRLDEDDLARMVYQDRGFTETEIDALLDGEHT